MLVDARAIPDEAAISADVCIVGAGAAGITLARSLARAPFRTVVIESGGSELDSAAQRLNEGEVVGLPYFPLIGSRLRYLGGTTNHWGGTCRPFDTQDFEPRPGVPGTGWPIGLDDVAPYYPEAARICGLSSTDWDTAGWVDRSPHAPIDLSPDVMETRIAQIVQPNRRSFNGSYRDELEAMERVTVYLHANVTEIVLEEGLNAVASLSIATLTGRRFGVEARCYVLAAGGIENPRLMLASNRQAPDGVGNGTGLVGRYFLEHPRFAAGSIAPLDRRLRSGLYEAHDVGPSRVIGYLAVPRSRQAAEGITDVQLRFRPTYQRAFERARRSEDADALRRVVNRIRRGRDEGDLLDDAEQALDDMTSWRRFLVPGAPFPVPQPEILEYLATASPDELDALVPEFFGDIAVFAYGEATDSIPIDSIELSARIDQAPTPDSRITLADRRDELGMPQPRLHWSLATSDRDSVQRTLEILAAELGRTGLGRLSTRLPDDGSWPEDLAGGYHHMGTTRMSANPREGVVDADCRVHGIPNLYVAGSSVFTTAGSATPTMTLVALALRLADHLKGEMA